MPNDLNTLEAIVRTNSRGTPETARTILSLIAELREARALMREAAAEIERRVTRQYSGTVNWPDKRDQDRDMDIVRRLRAAVGDKA